MSDALYIAQTDAAIAARWPSQAVETAILSPIALAAGATAEAARQEGFLGGPLVRDVVTVQGLRSDLLGKPIVLSGFRLGYDVATTCYVLGAEESETVELTYLTVLRRLA